MRNEAIRVSGWQTYTSGDPPTTTYSSGVSRAHVVKVSPENRVGNFVDPNPFRFTITSTKVSRAMREIGYRGYPSQRWDSNIDTVTGYNSGSMLLPYPYLSLDGPTVLRDRALAKIYGQLRGNSNLAVDVAESAQTIHMLRKALNVKKGFVSIVNVLINQLPPLEQPKRRNARLANGMAVNKRTGKHATQKASLGPSMGQQRLDYVTGKWLEYRYGWMPLINSCYDAYDNVMREQSAKRQIFVERSANRKEADVTISAKGGCYAFHPVRIEETLRERIRIVYEFMIPDKGIWDWTSLNPAAIAWDLLPLSHVVDWFFTVGQSLENLENYWLWKAGFIGGYETYTSEIEQHRSCTHEWNDPLPGFYGKANRETVIYDGSWRQIYKDRTLVTSLPFPGRPRFRVNLGSKQMLDTAALLHQFIGKRFR